MSFKSWRSYWEFHRSIVNESRYIPSDSINEFLQAVLNTCEKRKKTIPVESVLWRAQLGHDWVPQYEGENYLYDDLAPYRQSRMKPLVNEAKEGRANPKGIPFLYLASNEKTAIGEVRPWIGSMVSVGAFMTVRELHILDFSEEGEGALYYFEEPSEPEKEKQVWCDIGKAFSRPVTNSDSSAEYAPTQFLAELFRQNKYDGIVFKSSLGNGKNFVLFNLDDAEIKSCYLYEVKKLQFEADQTTNPYYVDPEIGFVG